MSEFIELSYILDNKKSVVLVKTSCISTVEKVDEDNCEVYLSDYKNRYNVPEPYKEVVAKLKGEK